MCVTDFIKHTQKFTAFFSQSCKMFEHKYLSLNEEKSERAFGYLRLLKSAQKRPFLRLRNNALNFYCVCYLKKHKGRVSF